MSAFDSFAQAFFGSSISTICLGLALGAPLLTLGNLYNLHLFPKNDEIEYETSTTQLVSQLTHSLALAFFGTVVLLSVTSAGFFAGLSARTQRSITVATAVLASTGLLMHLIGLFTLIKIALDWKKKLDEFPLPVPDVDVKWRAGLYADVFGLAATAATVILGWIAVTRLHRQSYIRLE